VFERLPDGAWENVGSGSPKMIAFMDITGAMRVRLCGNTYGTGYLWVSFVHPATRQQLQEVLRSRAKQIGASHLDRNYHQVAHIELPMWDIEEIKDFLTCVSSS